MARAAFGQVQREVFIEGATVIAVPGLAPTVAPGGLLALPSNMGTHRSSDFAVVTELGVGFGCQLTSCARARIGYTALCWPNVSRAGDQIDLVVNPNQLPPAQPGGPARPMFLGRTETLWVHAISIGLELNY
jgi:hypothetical protein